MLLNGMSLHGTSRFLICTRNPRAGLALSRKAKFEVLRALGLCEVAKRLDGSARGREGHGIARPEQGMYSIQMTAAYMYENRMVVIYIR